MSSIALPPVPDEYPAVRAALGRVAVHIVARARQQATGRFGLRVTPNGFGTPAFGDDVTRVRVAGPLLVWEAAGTGGATSRSIELDGASLRDLATVAGVDLAAPLDVGHDTPELGDPDVPLEISPASAEVLTMWFWLVASALDRALGALGPAANATVVQVWPEHFDVAVDVEAIPGERVNLGGSPGDEGAGAPYAYVGPWTDRRPGARGFWNAPFGATLGYDVVRRTADPIGSLVSFFVGGVGRFR